VDSRHYGDMARQIDPPIDDARLRALAAPIVAPEDLEDFIAMTISELGNLHEGNLARHRLRLSELRGWHARRGA